MVAKAIEQIQIVPLAFRMAEAVERVVERAREYYYAVVLSPHACPRCGGIPSMIGESRCRSDYCGAVFDPTVAFQRCSTCGGVPRLAVRRYSCRDCGADISSRFVFDGIIFDAVYFHQKMAEHRQRKRELRERVRDMLAGTRSLPIETNPIALDSVPGLLEALNGLTASGGCAFEYEPRSAFDLKAYQAHVEAQIGHGSLGFDDIPPLAEDHRMDRVWRFIAIIFLAHAGRIEVVQEGAEIMVMKIETDREGQGISGELEEADGVEGPLGRASVW